MGSTIFHEVRNVCRARSADPHENLARSGKLSEDQDFETLGTLVLALEHWRLPRSGPTARPRATQVG